MTTPAEPPASDATGVADFVVSRGTSADIARLRPLWLAVHQQHRRAMPELAPYVSDEESWSVRRALYEELMGRSGTVLLLAFDGADLIGYGLAHVMATPDSWLADTWRRGPRVGEIESLSVLPAYRGRGLGGRLLRELHAALQGDGVTDLILGLLAGNVDAQRLYERHGYQPTWLYLSRSQP